MNLSEWQHKLEAAGVLLAPGLSGPEIRRAEEAYEVRFPPDLAELLGFRLPTGRGWPDWRNVSDDEIENALRWPLDGILFDIENNNFWLPEWGVRPTDLSEAIAIARSRVADAPQLIPIVGHRYLPQAPFAAGNPVLSVYQTDIIYYGCDLAEYYANEFKYYFRGPGREFQVTTPVRKIEFWSLLVEGEHK